MKEDTDNKDSNQDIEQKLENLNVYLGHNAQVVTQSSIVLSALEQLLVDKGVLTQDEIEEKISKVGNQFLEKAREQQENEKVG